MTEHIKEQAHPHMLRVAAYIRVSTENPEQEDSYELQKAHFSERLTNTPLWISAGIYTDYGISGTSRERRTGFIRLLRHCEEGRIDHIITKSISRFARNTRDFLKALEILKTHRVTIDFEKEHLNTAISQNDLILTAYGALAQEESRSISANIQWSIRRHYPKGEARNIPIYGYRYASGSQAYQTTENGYTFRRVEIVEQEAAVVRRIFMETASGIPYTAIARELNHEQIPAPASAFSPSGELSAAAASRIPAGRLKPGLDEGWTARHITQIIRLERYTGDLLLQKTYKPDYSSRKVVRNKGERDQYYVHDHHPAIISRELFQEVQAIRKINSSRCSTHGSRTIYPFSGLLICGCCGRFYRTRNRTKRPLWYCSSTILNNGRNICSAGKLYEDQLQRICRKAFASRFHSLLSPYFLSSDCFSRTFSGTSFFPSHYTAQYISIFFKALLMKLESLQTIDTIEHDRAYLLTQIAEKKNELGRPGTDSPYQDRYPETEAAIQELTDRLNHLEAYCSALEATYEWRKRAIKWIRALPENQQGITDFFNGFTSEYTKAFVLSIEISSPSRYRFHWFDDTWSSTELLFSQC